MRRSTLAVCLFCCLSMLLSQPAAAQFKHSRCDELATKFADAAAAYEAKKDKRLLSVMHEKAKDIEWLSADRYRDMETNRSEGNAYGRDASMTEYQYCAPKAIDAMLATAKAYVNVGIYDIPKKIYRDIITTYTGPAWTSYVKKAEFGLEDLKSAEAKRKTKK